MKTRFIIYKIFCLWLAVFTLIFSLSPQHQEDPIKSKGFVDTIGEKHFVYEGTLPLEPLKLSDVKIQARHYEKFSNSILDWSFALSHCQSTSDMLIKEQLDLKRYQRLYLDRPIVLRRMLI